MHSLFPSQHHTVENFHSQLLAVHPLPSCSTNQWAGLGWVTYISSVAKYCDIPTKSLPENIPSPVRRECKNDFRVICSCNRTSAKHHPSIISKQKGSEHGKRLKQDITKSLCTGSSETCLTLAGQMAVQVSFQFVAIMKKYVYSSIRSIQFSALEPAELQDQFCSTLTDRTCRETS